MAFKHLKILKNLLFDGGSGCLYNSMYKFIIEYDRT